MGGGLVLNYQVNQFLRLFQIVLSRMDGALDVSRRYFAALQQRFHLRGSAGLNQDVVPYLSQRESCFLVYAAFIAAVFLVEVSYGFRSILITQLNTLKVFNEGTNNGFALAKIPREYRPDSGPFKYLFVGEKTALSSDQFVWRLTIHSVQHHRL